MNRTTIRAGLRQAGVNLRGDLLSPAILGHLLLPTLAAVFALVMRGSTMDQAATTVGQFMLPGWLTLSLVSGGLIGVTATIMMEKEDGTLLRMKTLPGGMQGYVLGRTVHTVAVTLFTLVLTIVPVAIIIPDVVRIGPGGWLGLLGYTALGLLSVLPFGALVGALLRNMVTLSVCSLMLYVLMGVSGLFFPIGLMPTWAQWTLQIFPPYWIGLGMRSVMLPAEAAVLEVGGSFRTVETLVVLGIWAGAGLVFAPRALRRMVRGVSGSQMAKARERILARGY